MPFSLTPEPMAARHPDLFRISAPAPKATFAEQHAATSAVAAFNVGRQPMPPVACSLLAARIAAGNAFHT